MSQSQALTGLQTATNGLSSGMLTLPVTGLVIPAAKGGMEFGSALATVDAEETDFTALDSLTKKVAYVIKRSPRYMAGALKKQFEAGLRDAELSLLSQKLEKLENFQMPFLRHLGALFTSQLGRTGQTSHLFR